MKTFPAAGLMLTESDPVRVAPTQKARVIKRLPGTAVSHGCVRASNQTALKLKAYALLGAPIWIKK